VRNKLYFNNIYNDHFIPQYLFLYGNSKNILIDQVFKYENLDESIKYLKYKLKIDNDLPFLILYTSLFLYIILMYNI
jgi:hypothetical protein